MHILLVAATSLEIEPLLATVRLPGAARFSCRGHDVDVLETGVGMVATAARCTRALAAARFDLALNFGVCGSFDPVFAPGSVVHIVSERIAELGAEDGERFLTVQELGLLGADEPPFTGGALVNGAPPDNRALRRLPSVRGITVNTVHGNEPSIVAAVQRFAPQVESMEGAAFMYACLIQRVPFAEVRAVSNVVERRHRDAWKMSEAIDVLARTGIEILECL
jgi:futalosine hydrolase